MCLKYEKDVKPTNGLTKHINAYKIPISLLCYLFSNPDPVLDYNMTNLLDLLLDNNNKGITALVSNHNDSERTRLADISNNKEDIRPVNIDKQKPATPH